MRFLKDFWNGYRMLIIAAGLIILLCLAVHFKDEFSDWWHGVKRSEYNAKIAADQKQIDTVQADNAVLRGQIQSDLQQADARQVQIDSLNKEMAKYGVQAQKAVEAQKQAASNYENDIQAINSDSSLYDRCRSLCSERDRLNFPCRPTVQQYCQQYADK